MLGEFVMRLAIALPLVCGLAALCLWAVKRGRLKWPMLALPARAQAGTPLLDVLDVRALSPAARLAVIRFEGRTHLVGVAGQTISLLTPGADAGATPAEGPQ
jgi:flagellar biogenesis protein FliO